MTPDEIKDFKELDRRVAQLEQKRVRKQDIQNGAVGNRALGDVIQNVETSTASATFGNGDQLLLTHTLTQNEGARLLAGVDMSVYIGSVDSTNQLPGGSNIDETKYQFISPWLDWGLTDNNNIVVKTYVLNISAGSVTVIFKMADRYLSNYPGSGAS